MAITARDTGSGNYELAPSGNHVARCIRIIHLGTIQTNFGAKNTVVITWELPTKMKKFHEDESERPFTISKQFTLSLSEKANLRKFLEGWRGRSFTEKELDGFDLSKLIGLPCLLNVIHGTSKNGNQYADITGASILPEGMTCPEQFNDSIEFGFEPFNHEIFEKLADYYKDKIRTTPEFATASGEYGAGSVGSNQDEESDDLPF